MLIIVNNSDIILLDFKQIVFTGKEWVEPTLYCYLCAQNAVGKIQGRLPSVLEGFYGQKEN